LIMRITSDRGRITSDGMMITDDKARSTSDKMRIVIRPGLSTGYRTADWFVDCLAKGSVLLVNL